MYHCYTFHNSNLGTTESHGKFTWRLSNTIPSSLTIALETSSRVYKNISMTEFSMMHDEGSLSKELIYDGTKYLSKEDIISYKINDIFFFGDEAWGDGVLFGYMTPPLLTIYTKNGIYRMYREKVGQAARSVCILADTPDYVYFKLNKSNFFSVETYKEKKPYDQTFYAGVVCLRYVSSVENGKDLSIDY